MNRKKCWKCKKTIVGNGKFGLCKRCYADLPEKLQSLIITFGVIYSSVKLFKSVKGL